MKNLEVGQSIGILANLGVIAGIVFLAIEISQNQASLDEQNALNRQSARDLALTNFANMRHLLLQDDDLLETYGKGDNDEEMSGLEREKWSLLCLDTIWAHATTYQSYSSVGERDSAASDVVQMRSRLSRSENWRRCWDNVKQGLASRGWEEFVYAVDE